MEKEDDSSLRCRPAIHLTMIYMQRKLGALNLHKFSWGWQRRLDRGGTGWERRFLSSPLMSKTRSGKIGMRQLSTSKGNRHKI